jgi:deferrochelatase/peroxidase EfeB
MITRRELLQRSTAAGLALSGLALWPPRAAAGPLPPPQPGIATPMQAKLEFAAFDLRASGPEDIRDLLRSWTKVTDETLGSADRSHLSITVGLGPSLFDGQASLADRRPMPLVHLPAFRGDELDPARCGGDLCVQACADDHAVARDAIARFAAVGNGLVAERWRQTGFGRAAKTMRRAATPRNLLGFKDGTDNIDGADPRSMARHVWTRGPDWMAGGSYLVARRIRMRLRQWADLPVGHQERIVGRRKMSGAPLGGKRERDIPKLSLRRGDGTQVIPAHAHIRLAAPSMNGGIRVLRRGYGYDDGERADGERDAGLFFISFQRDPAQFVALQRMLTTRRDALLEYVVHESSAVFACPPAARAGGFIGDGLFQAVATRGVA